jgi:hypothetical protein
VWMIASRAHMAHFVASGPLLRHPALPARTTRMRARKFARAARQASSKTRRGRRRASHARLGVSCAAFERCACHSERALPVDASSLIALSPPALLCRLLRQACGSGAALPGRHAQERLSRCHGQHRPVRCLPERHLLLRGQRHCDAVRTRYVWRHGGQRVLCALCRWIISEPQGPDDVQAVPFRPVLPRGQLGRSSLLCRNLLQRSEPAERRQLHRLPHWLGMFNWRDQPHAVLAWNLRQCPGHVRLHALLGGVLPGPGRRPIV